MYVSVYSPAYVLVSKIMLPPSQIVSMIVFVRTQTDTLISAGGIPEGTAGEVTEADVVEVLGGRLGAAEEAMDEEDGGTGLLKK